MAKKPSETSAPEASAAKKPATRKTAAKKTAASAKKAADQAEKKPVADAAPVEAPKTNIKTVKSAAKSSARTKTVKAAKKAADKEAPASSPADAPQSAAPAPADRVEKSADSEPVRNTETAAPVKVKRESYRPNRNAEQQERHEQHGGEVFAQPETVGGASEAPFNKRKRRRRNKKGNGGFDDRQPVQDAVSLKNLDTKKVASRAWKLFLAEVSEEGLALMDDQTAREAARKAFRCAEFFMVEESRRKQPHGAPAQQEKNASPEEDRDAEEDGEE